MNLSAPYVIDTVWYGSDRLPYKDIAEGKLQSDIVSGAVLIYNLHHFRAFIGVGTSGNEDEDIRQIYRWGQSIPKEVALAIFGNRETDLAGVHATLDTHYRF